MIERTILHFGRLVFDQDDIVRAALRASVENALTGLRDFQDVRTIWTGDLQRGAFYTTSDGGDDVVAWTEAGVVGFALDAGRGPIQQLDLSVDAVTGGPDDVRGAVPDLPEELLPAFDIAFGLFNPRNPQGRSSLPSKSLWASGFLAIASEARSSTSRPAMAPGS